MTSSNRNPPEGVDPVEWALRGLGPDQRAAALRAIHNEPERHKRPPFVVGKKPKPPAAPRTPPSLKSGLSPAEARQRRKELVASNPIKRVLVCRTKFRCPTCNTLVERGDQYALSFDSIKLCGLCGAQKPRLNDQVESYLVTQFRRYR